MYDGFHRGTGSTPVVEGISTYVPVDNSPTDITDLLGGVKGQRVIIFGNSNITLVRSSTFIVKRSEAAQPMVESNAVSVICMSSGAAMECGMRWVRRLRQ
jgi:hypothetical protein